MAFIILILARPRTLGRGSLALLLLLAGALPASAQLTVPSPAVPEEIAFALQGALPPTLPETVRRDEEGRVTTRAVRLLEPLQLDGRLDEAIYETVRPISDFIQNEPVNESPATEKTEVWVSFDERNIYVSVRAWESTPDRMVVNEMRRDNFGVLQNENFAFMFDTFFDKRNAVVFQFNPLGGRMDGQAVNDGNYNGDWNPLWRLAVGEFDGGWTAEAMVPFKSLAYGAGQTQVWGFNARRINRWKNEVSFITRLPTGTGNNGITRPFFAAPLVGLEAPSSTRVLDVKPYVISDVNTNVPSNVRNELGGDFGLDVRYSITQNLSADFTYNTDFAQVEADEQQVNLTRFSLFFPEKREFFLENQGLFNFGGVEGNNNNNVNPRLFYSRRIGLDGGQAVPILAGGRLTGRMGEYSLGVINIATEASSELDLPATNFSVARIRRNVLRRSAVGAIFTGRSDTPGSQGSAMAYGVDGTWAFYENLEFQTMWAKSQNPGLVGEDTTFRLRMGYDADRYGVTIDRTGVGRNFDPSVGFLRRRNFQRLFAQGRFSPRLPDSELIRKLQYQVQLQYVESNAGVVETRQQQGQFQIQFNNSDVFQAQHLLAFELLPQDFEIADGIVVPAGGYTNDEFSLQYTFGRQRRLAGSASFEYGPLYDGTRTAVSFTGARTQVGPQLSLEPSVQWNKVDLPYGNFKTQIYSSRVTYTITPMVFVSGLVQYSSSNNSLSANVRMRWEYIPGSEFFVVYNEGRDTSSTGAPLLQNRSFIVKFNRLLRF
ncbi:MAG: carbohydrate binding family 9 domain-containing protein [Acidobacteria bacterium]|nr:carbohydrate binding family 9 domain-containing protein [Acidobacteriota bacterium]